MDRFLFYICIVNSVVCVPAVLELPGGSGVKVQMETKQARGGENPESRPDLNPIRKPQP